jgi:hypothetical protein
VTGVGGRYCSAAGGSTIAGTGIGCCAAVAVESCDSCRSTSSWSVVGTGSGWGWVPARRCESIVGCPLAARGWRTVSKCFEVGCVNNLK